MAVILSRLTDEAIDEIHLPLGLAHQTGWRADAWNAVRLDDIIGGSPRMLAQLRWNWSVSDFRGKPIYKRPKATGT